MRASSIAFSLVLFAVFKAMVLLQTQTCLAEEAAGLDEQCLTIPDLEFPSFDIEFNAKWDPDWQTNGTGLNAIGDTIANVAIAVGEIGEFLSAAVVWLFEVLVASFKLTVVIVKAIVFFISLTFTTIPGAPWFIDVVMIIPLIVGVLFLAIAAFKGGGADA